MQRVIYALQPLRKSIFLAGPTPREPSVKSWRPEALKMLEDLNFDGDIFVPESEDWSPHSSYDEQIMWEWHALNAATVVVFWIPRDIETMPAFTTNVEFGMLASSSKVVYGRPIGAPKTRYLDKLADRHHVPTFNDLWDTIRYAVWLTTH